MELLEEELQIGTSPSRIAFLTFTRAAREEALARTGKTEAEFPFLRTIHAICYRQINLSQDQVVKPSDLRAFGKELGIKLNGNITDPWVEEFDRSFEAPTRDDMLLQINHCGRHKGILLKEALAQSSVDIDYKYAMWFTKAYRNWKTKNGMLDYTDMLTNYLDYGFSLDIDSIFVDEAQDLSSLQWEVVSKLGFNAKRWFIAGDDDQAIFHWAGADSSAFQDLSTDITEVLGQSYRVSRNVYETAMRITGRMKKRLPKDYSPTPSEGKAVNIGFLHSIDWREKSFVLFRNHYRGQELARQLKEDSVPYIGHGSPLTNQDVRIALVGWYRLIKNGEITQLQARKLVKFSDEDHLQLNIKTALSQAKTLKMNDIFIKPPNWFEWSKIMNKLPGIDIIENCVRRVGFLRTSKPSIELLSIHQSKGREAHTVVLDTDVSRAVYDEMMRNPDDEHRVWYVGVTRAKERVFCLLPEGVYSYKVL
jgi:superfamily I DNA/RNA helicase